MNVLLISILSILALTLSALTSAAQAREKRIGLLIGNQTYLSEVGPLQNPINDIELVNDALLEIGFKTTLVRDGDRRTISEAVVNFAQTLRSLGLGAVGFFYYAGHGAARALDKTNYMIPVDVKSMKASSFWIDAVSLEWILNELRNIAPEASHFIVFDACRNELRLPSRAAARGFVPVPGRAGMFLAFSTSPNDFASDGEEENGPYASALASEIVKPNVDHLNMFQSTKEAVYFATRERQLAWEQNGLLRRIYFAGRHLRNPGSVTTQQKPDHIHPAALMWQDIKDTNSMSALQSFVTQFPDTKYAFWAKERLSKLSKLRNRNLFTVYFGTNRAVELGNDKYLFGVKQSEHLNLGRVTISIPRKRSEIPIWLELERDPKKHVTVTQTKILETNELGASVKESLEETQFFKGQAFVFVHGYNVSFEAATVRAALIAYDLGYDGIPFMFSWPSQGSTIKYLSDLERANTSSEYFQRFLEEIAKQRDIKTIHLISHGTGAIPLLTALRNFAFQKNKALPRIGQVILATPDIDRGAFEKLVAPAASIADGITLYVASNDRALRVANIVLKGSHRAGDVPQQGPVVVGGVDTIDVTAVRVGGHDINSSALLKDIALLLQTGIRPPDRRSVAMERVYDSPRGIYWRHRDQ